MEKTIENLKALENEIKGICDILTRSDYTFSDINHLLNAKSSLWNAYISVWERGHYNKVFEALKQNQNALLTITDGFYHAFEMWCYIIGSCKVGVDSDMLSTTFISWFIDLCQKSLHEVRALIERIEELKCE